MTAQAGRALEPTVVLTTKELARVGMLARAVPHRGDRMSGGPRGTPPPLDLKAVEARLMQKIRHRSDEVLTIGCDTARDIVALLAHARALRAALLDAQEWAAGYPLGGGTDTIAARQVYDRAAAVLGAAQDGPA